MRKPLHPVPVSVSVPVSTPVYRDSWGREKEKEGKREGGGRETEAERERPGGSYRTRRLVDERADVNASTMKHEERRDHSQHLFQPLDRKKTKRGQLDTESSENIPRGMLHGGRGGKPWLNYTKATHLWDEMGVVLRGRHRPGVLRQHGRLDVRLVR